jgi:hypothetical protein
MPFHATSNAEYTDDLVKKELIGNYNNPMAKEMRNIAKVKKPQNVAAVAGPPRDRTKLYESVQTDIGSLTISSNLEKFILKDENHIIVSEARNFGESLRAAHPDAEMTTRLVFVTGNEAMIKQQYERPRKISTRFGDLLKAEQHNALREDTPSAGCVFVGTKTRFYSGNPAHIGKRDRKNPKSNYRMTYAYDVQGQQLIGIVKTVSFDNLQLPFIHQVCILRYTPTARVGQ